MDTIALTAIFFAVNVVHTLGNLLYTWSYKRTETFGVVFHKDGTNTRLKINTGKETFIYGKESYLIPVNSKEYLTTINNKKYIRYVEGNPNPFKWSNDVKPDIPADVFHSVLQNSGLKLLNSPPLSADFIKYVLIGVVVLGALYFFFGTGTVGQ